MSVQVKHPRPGKPEMAEAPDSPTPRKRMSHLPVFRFTGVATLLVALDSLACVALWLAGGDTTYLEDSVEDFSFTHSTFDLACIAAVRGVVLIACFYYLEHYTLMQVSVTTSKRRQSSRTLVILCRFSVLLTSSITLIYAVVKGGFIVQQIVSKNWNSSSNPELNMSMPYKILCVAAIVFPALEFVVGVASWYFLLRMIRVQQLRLVINQQEGEEEDKPKKKVDLRRLVLLAKPEYPLILLGIVSLIISSGCVSLAPYLFGKVINYAIPSTNCTAKYGPHPPTNVTCTPYTMWRMNQEVLLLVGVFLAASIASFCRATLFGLAGERFVARLRKKLFTTILQQEMGFFDKSRTGELTSRLGSDSQVVQDMVTNNISMLARYTLQMLISIGFMFYVSAKLTAVLLSVVPIIAIAAVQYGRFLKSLRKGFQDKLAHANSTAEESISNMVTVRSFSSEPKMMDLYAVDIDESYRLGRKLAILSGIFIGVVGMLMYGSASLVLWYGGYLVWHGSLQPGTLIALMLYTLNLAMCFAFLSNLYGEFMQAVGASVRIFELLDRVSEIKDGTLVFEPFKGGIIFENVCFSYPSRPDEQVLKDVSFTVHPGQVVALVGPSGGGKSTIVRLIEHFYELSSGRVLLGGHNLRDLDPTWYRRHIGLVSQEPVLFARSIADNITYGKDDATMDEVEEVARQANAQEFVTSFEDGYDTMVGERGVRLSGGQKQRIAIARALLLNPDILLLDEATSALDAESEHLVQEAIDRAMKGRTVLVIAHRLSTVRDASQVVVIEKGCVVEQGTHDELLAQGGVYKQLVLRQLTAGDIGNGQLTSSDESHHKTE